MASCQEETAAEEEEKDEKSDVGVEKEKDQFLTE